MRIRKVFTTGRKGRRTCSFEHARRPGAGDTALLLALLVIIRVLVLLEARLIRVVLVHRLDDRPDDQREDGNNDNHDDLVRAHKTPRLAPSEDFF